MPVTLAAVRRKASRFLTTLLALSLAASSAACGISSASSGKATADPSKPLVVSASSVPHAEILRHIVSSGTLGSTTLDIKEISGDVDPNQLLVAGDIDANYFQHAPYEKAWAQEHGATDLVDVAAVHVEPLGLYGKNLTSTAQLPAGSTIALSNNVTNYARGLFLLQAAQLITLDAKTVADVDVTQFTEKRIVANPKNLRFVQVDPAQLPRTLSDGKVAAAVINGNYALEAGLKPASDALALESADNNPYANVLTTVTSKKDDPRIAALARALTSAEVAAWIASTYGGSVVPVRKP